MSKRTIVDADKALSRSLLWQIQRAYFAQAGMAAWQNDVVPSDISSNPVMARSYSQIVFGYLRDCFAAAQRGEFALDSDQPIHIIELGAGSGRLAYHFLQTFLPKYQQSPFASQPIRYVMTDFVPEILEFWRNHERFRPFFEAGILDVALFDVMGMERPFHLQLANQTLTSQTNPVILIANYFFDSIPQDSFVIEDGLLCQNLLTLTSSQPEPDLADPTLWDRLELHYEPIPLADVPYEEPLYNQILDSYEATLPDCSFSFPNVGLDCVRHWAERSRSGRLLLLTSDRGYSTPDALISQPDPLPNLHGSFSLMVNYQAIGEFVWRSEGLVCQVPHYQDNIQVLAYLLGQIPQQGLETRLAFTDAVGRGGPDDFQALKSVVEKQYGGMSLPEMLSFLRLSGWDASIFTDLLPHLHKAVETADPAWYPDVADALHRVEQIHLPLRPEDDLRPKINKLLDWMGLGD
ncbi:MAG: SAM-dependent methyltransferase [Chloroflexota bacterium]